MAAEYTYISESKRRISPEWCSFVSDDCSKLYMEFVIPGVKKENIKLKLLNDTFTVSAPKDGVEYIVSGGFRCPIKSTEVKATYDNGLLKIEAPLQNIIDGAVNVTIH